MSRLNPPRSNIELPNLPPQPSPLQRTSDVDGAATTQTRRLPAKRSFYTQFAAAVRWLHIYVSLLGFTALVFFAVTGITLNHPQWFGVEALRTSTHEGDLNLAWLQLPAGTQATSEALETSPDVRKLEIVEHLRLRWRLRGAVSEFRTDEYECLILFKGPGYSADAVINRETGHYMITETVMGVVAIINDLHKGRDTGLLWSWVIDLTAALMVFVSITGIVLIFYLKRKRMSGIITAVVGTILFAVIYVWFVP